MKNFSIKVINIKPEFFNGSFAYWGMIQIGEFKERFMSPVGNWSIEDYQRQWKEGIERLTYKSKSCLVTIAQTYSYGEFLDFWILFKEGDKVFIRNNMLFGKKIRTLLKKYPLTPETCYKFIRAGRRKKNDGEYKVSEWVVDLSDLIKKD